MKKKLFALLLSVSFLLSGCVTTAIQTYNTAMNMRSLYQGYEAYSMVKSVKDKTPVFKEYQVAFISFDVQPRKGNAGEVNKVMAEAYSRSFNEMAKDLGLTTTCTPYNETAVGVAPEALIVQVQEIKTGLVGTIMSGENLHAKVRYIDKRTAKVLVEEEYNPLKGYDGMLNMMTASAMAKLLGSGPGEQASEAQKSAWADKTKKFAEQSAKYQILTDEERKLLAQG